MIRDGLNCYKNYCAYFHFLLLKLGYSNKTNNPNDSPSKRMFGLFSCGRSGENRTPSNLGPKPSAIPLGDTPKCEKYSIFRSISVSGQICGQTTWNGIFAREDSAKEVSVYKGFRRFLLRDALGAVSCSQSKRATNCATPRNNSIAL